MPTKDDPLKPPSGVLINLGSLLVHVEELFETPSVHKGKSIGDAIAGLAASADFDLAAIRQTLDNPDVRAWRERMGALLPVKRH